MASALGYGDVGAYRDVAAGSYAVSVRPAGSSPTAPPAISVRVEVPPGGIRTLALSGAFADLGLAALPDDLTAPNAGTVRARVLAAAAGAPVVDVTVVGGGALATDLPFPAASGYVTVPAGPTMLRLSTATDHLSVPVNLVPGTVVSVLVLDAPAGGLTARVVLDAAAPAVVPVGAVEAGGSGTRFHDLPVVLNGGSALPAWALATAAVLRSHASSTSAPRGDASAPVRVRVPAAGIDAALLGSGLDRSGALQVPADASVAGWYAAGPVPGQPGPAVLAGHVDWADRPAVFDGLHRVAAGDEIVIDATDGTSTRFAVSRVLQVAKDAFPTGAVYGPVPGAELRLITCGGTFDPAAGSYPDNVVVFARLLG